MKKILFLILATVLTLASCSSAPVPPQVQSAPEVIVNLSVETPFGNIVPGNNVEVIRNDFYSINETSIYSRASYEINFVQGSAETVRMGKFYLYRSSDLLTSLGEAVEMGGEIIFNFPPEGQLAIKDKETFCLKGEIMGTKGSFSVSLQTLEGFGLESGKTIKVKGLPSTGNTLILNTVVSEPEPLLTVTWPNGREEWKAGESYEIRWEASPMIGKINIEVLLKEGESELAAILATNIVADTSSYIWEIPENFGPGVNNFKIAIKNTPNWGPVATDTSDDWFSILPPDWCYAFWTITPLEMGDSGEYVWALQKALNLDPDTMIAESGPGSHGNETDYFGPLTRSAVIKFQEKYASDILAPSGLTEGTGYVGMVTLAKLQQLYGCETLPEPEDKIKVIWPNGGEEVTIGKTYAITWKSSGIETVNVWIEWSQAVGSNLAENISASQESLSWVVNEDPGELYRIRVSANEKAGVSDESDEFFSIWPPEYNPPEVDTDLLREQITQVLAQLASLQNQLTELEATKETLQGQIDSLLALLAALQGQLTN